MAFNRRRGVEPVLFQPKDTDDLNDALCAGRFDRVLFWSTDDLLEAIWNNDADLDAWKRAGVEIEILSRAPGQAENLANAHVVDLQAVWAGLEKWREERRGAKIIAATVLCVLAILSMALLLLR
ncbi:MAG TPA: hypothetical protein VNT79_19295 [Phycisphaerae bacterium]|nr:hypothetical protein [Phycisphaerae bacterium]